MILPNNGKVVIIDDQPEDVIELISALSKEKVPFVHYKEEDLSDLPETPIENVRLIFLDLELITNTYVDPKNITAPIKTRLIRILKPRSPYALVIWSKKENTYKEALIKDFEDEFNNYKPIFHTSLPKADIIGKEGAMFRIKKELEIEIAKFNSFNAFLVWEAIVNEASGKITNEITSSYPHDLNWDKKTKFLLYKLAVAYSGKAVNNFTDIKQLRNALYTLTLSLTETIESSIDKKIGDSFAGMVNSREQLILNFTSLINKLLLISDGNTDLKQPGNIFFPQEEIESRIGINEESLFAKNARANLLPEEKRSHALQGIDKKYRNEKQKLQEELALLKKTSNIILSSGLKVTIYKDDSLTKKIFDNAIPIELNITPLCDYAQQKAILYRILPSLMVKSEFREYLNPSPNYVYVSDADIRIAGIDYLFLFDFRFLYALDKSKIEKRIVKFRLKQQLLSDIQIKLGAHINRAGVLFVS